MPVRFRPLPPVVLLALALASVLQLVLVNYWPRFASPNERAHVYQAIAVADRGALDIDAEIARFGPMEDIASARGRTFSDKAPGLLPLLLPGAFVARLVAGGGDAELAWALALGRLLACSVPFVATVFLLAGVATKLYPRGAPFAAVVLAVGTPLLVASLLAFSHALSACLLFAAFVLLHEGDRPAPPAALAAGALLGWAAASEYTTVAPAAVLAAAALPRLGGRGTLRLALGAAVPLALLAAYNAACFGSPFVLSSSREAHAAFAAVASQGLVGVGLPSMAGLAEMLVLPSRGAIVWAPAIVLAFWPGRHSALGGIAFSGRLALVVAPVVLLLAISGYPNRSGHWFAGPRHLLMVFPLLALLLARGAEAALARPAGRVAATVAATWGAVMAWPCIVTFPFPPEDYPLPAFTVAWPLLRGGVLAPSWLPDSVLAPLLAILAALAAVTLIAAATPRARPRERLVAVLLAAVPVAVAAALVRPPDTWKAGLEAAVIHDVYTAATPPGALEALRPRADTDGRRAQLEEWIAHRDATRR